MTEAEWAACDNPKSMIGSLSSASERKFRLFCCACCRRVWHSQTDQRVREAVAGVERYADEPAREELREQALEAASRVRGLEGYAAKWAAVAVARTGAMMVVDAAGQAAACPPGQDYDPLLWQAEWRAQCGLLRDIFGPLPFRTIRIDPAWVTWNDAVVRRLAEETYEGRSLPNGLLHVTRMGVLADALEDAGCADPGLLGHLRGPGPHVRGCWAIDLLLGRE